MKRHALFVAAFLGLGVSPGISQEGATDRPALFDEGQRLYRAECSTCHRPQGQGATGYPPLNNNVRLEDLSLVVERIHRGEGAMRAFPQFDERHIAALATFVRTSWANDFGAVTPEEVAEVLAALPEREGLISVWDGVYTSEQAAAGERVFVGRCGSCHGPRGDGVGGDPDQPAAPPIAGSSFLREWDGQTAYAVFAYSWLRMPTINPGSLSDEEYAQALAYMFSQSGLPEGEEPLGSSRSDLINIVISATPAD